MRLLYTILFVILFCIHDISSTGTANLNTFPLVTTESSYKIYEGEYLTVCVELQDPKDLSNVLGSELTMLIQNGNSNFDIIEETISIKDDGNCFHFRSKASNSIQANNYNLSFASTDDNIIPPVEQNVVVNKVGATGKLLNENSLFFKGLDSSIDGYDSDKIILGNSEKITPFTSFSLSTYQTNQGSTAGYSSGFNFMYMGGQDLDENGVFCIVIDGKQTQLYGDIPDIEISFNGNDISSDFSITNSLPLVENSSVILPNNEMSIVSIGQGEFFSNTNDEIVYSGSTISSVTILPQGTSGGNNFTTGFDTGAEFSPIGDFNVIFICNGQLYFCDIEELLDSAPNWSFQNGGQGIDDFNDQACLDFCDLVNSDCNDITYDVEVVDCEIVFSISDCTILLESDVTWYYSPASSCNNNNDFVQLDLPFEVNKTSPTTADIVLPVPHNQGCYKIEVLCEECTSPIVYEFELSECCPFAHTISSQESMCMPTGGIDLEITGVGTPPFTYSWNTGQSTQDIFNISEGDYTVTVTDKNGCQTEISTTLGTCCCDYSLDLGGPGLEISEIYVNQSLLSNNSSFDFPYDIQGQTESQSTLLDLANDITNFEAPDGSAYVSNNVLYIESCNSYDYFIGTNLFGKTDLCENNIVSPIENSCGYLADEECNLDMDLNSNHDCSIDVIVNSNVSYTINLEHQAVGSSDWVVVESGILYSINLTDLSTGLYRLHGIGLGVCEDVYSCDIQHLCCECEISSTTIIGDYLNDGEFCEGVDSVGFHVLTSGCLGTTTVDIQLPDGTTQSLTEMGSNEFSGYVNTDIDVDDSGIYFVSASDQVGCLDINGYTVNVENCELCENCDLLMSVYSNQPGKLNASDLTVSCGMVDSFQITWYLNQINSDNILFQSGTGENTINHPIVNFPIQGGTIIPKLDWISINGEFNDETYPGIGNCLDSVQVQIPNCDATYSTNYNFNTGQFPNRTIQFAPDEDANYLYLTFRGYHVVDTIIATNNGDTLLYANVGSDNNGTQTDNFPYSFDISQSMTYLIPSDLLNLQLDSLITIEIRANSLEDETNWWFSIRCVDEYRCGSLGNLDVDDISCNFDSTNCRYNFHLPHPDKISMLNLPYKGSQSLGEVSRITYNPCTKQSLGSFASEDYCEIDSIFVSANESNQTYTFSFQGSSNFYHDVKTSLINGLNAHNINCIYNDTVSYYRRMNITARTGNECSEQGEGDGSNGPYYTVNFSIHPCAENIVFDDAQSQIIFQKTDIVNYQQNNCDECKNYIQTNFVNPINANVNENYIGLEFPMYQVLISNSAFSYRDVNDLSNESLLTRSQSYSYLAEELCGSAECKRQRYKVVIDNFEDACSNFSVYEDSSPCDNTYVYDSLVYQVSNGIELFILPENNYSMISSDLLTQTSEDFDPELKLYPNPVYKWLNVEFTSNNIGVSKITLYNTEMKKMSSYDIDSSKGWNKQNIDVSNYPSGLYFIEVQSGKESLYQQFIVID